MPSREFQVPGSRFQEASPPAWAQNLGVGHIGEYFGLWAILPEALKGALSRVQQINLQLHVEQAQAREPALVSGGSRDYAVTAGGVAVIELRGPLMKQASSLSGGTSTVRVRRQIRDAAADDEVSAILLKIDSPGGTVAGAVDLGDEIARAAKRKPLDAYIEDLGASGAYWAASQARRIFTNRAGIVGSIGTYGVLYDQSGAAAMQGLKVHVVRAGEFKGAGYPGTEITAEILADEQQLVDALNEHFIRDVATGRKFTLDKTRALADGRVHVGEAALELGLVDGIQSFDDTLSSLGAKSRSSRTMSVESTAGETRTEAAPAIAAASHAAPQAAQPATYAELKAALAGADAEFICRQMEVNATLAQAQAAWMTEQGVRLKAAEAKIAAAEKQAAEAAAAAAKRPGASPLGSRRKADAEDGDGDEDDGEEAKSDWDRLVEAEQKKLGNPDKARGGLTNRARAIANAAKKRPDLHRAVVAAANGDFVNGVPRVFQR